MKLNTLPKKFRRKYANEIVKKGDYTIVKYADGNTEIIKRYALEKNNPYNCLSKVVEETGDVKVDVMNIDVLSLDDLRKMAAYARSQKYSQKIGEVKQQENQDETVTEECLGGRVKHS